MGACEYYGSMHKWERYVPPGSPEYYSPTEEECQEGCTVMAQKYGPGCCQYGVAQTRNQPPSCLYSKGFGAQEQSYSGYNDWQRIHKQSICTTSAEVEEESAIGHETIANVGASGSDIPMLVNVFAAIGLCAMVYGAFRHYTQK